jgi:hypothetical protein
MLILLGSLALSLHELLPTNGQYIRLDRGVRLSIFLGWVAGRNTFARDIRERCLHVIDLEGQAKTRRAARKRLFHEENREVELVLDGYRESIRDFEFDLKTENIDIPVARSHPVADWNLRNGSPLRPAETGFRMAPEYSENGQFGSFAGGGVLEMMLFCAAVISGRSACTETPSVPPEKPSM